MAEGLSIAEVAGRLGVSAHTLRYYERCGLLDHVGRNSGGHRRYTDDEVQAVDFLLKMRKTGLGISGLRDYVESVRRGEDTLAYRAELLRRHRVRVLDRIAELQKCLDIIDWKLENVYCGFAALTDSPTQETHTNGTKKDRRP